MNPLCLLSRLSQRFVFPKSNDELTNYTFQATRCFNVAFCTACILRRVTSDVFRWTFQEHQDCRLTWFPDAPSRLRVAQLRFTRFPAPGRRSASVRSKLGFKTHYARRNESARRRLTGPFLPSTTAWARLLLFWSSRPPFPILYLPSCDALLVKSRYSIIDTSLERTAILASPIAAVFKTLVGVAGQPSSHGPISSDTGRDGRKPHAGSHERFHRFAGAGPGRLYPRGLRACQPILSLSGHTSGHDVTVITTAILTFDAVDIEGFVVVLACPYA